ncbi:U-box domain-containing protein 17 [Hibiscus syriacus]|uniref:RING-type E3 ubiquitin transferase n=1 Tax=Hibiscus syriacus TaxID=106335 RepID=A0A6A3CJ08_HIBSY|nr:U-box domain-containing protein 17-like [Hibiscus syriacus]KAE8728746.1 U-box domain-containing protein 17 [Hibiscus syriacus]
MASAAIFSSLRRRRSPSLEAFLAPVDLTEVALVQTLAAVSSELISCFANKVSFFQRMNSRSLIRKMEVFLILLEYLRDSGSGSTSNLPSTAILCFKELYLLLYRSKILLDYCAQSSKLWLLLQNHSISGHFHDLNQEISTLLDVFPIHDVGLSDDVREHVEMLQKHARKAKLYVDKSDENLRLRFFSFLDEFEKGRIPNHVDLRLFFVERLGIGDAENCRFEIEFLEEQIVNHEGDVEPTACVLNGFVAITRYCRFLLFGFQEDEVKLPFGNQKKPRKGLITREIADTFITIPKDFCCPISLNLLTDPVIISTGQTYDRSSIVRWMEEGHCTCPKTGQMLIHTHLVPNRSLKSLIMQWCTAHNVPYDPVETADGSTESFAEALPIRAATEANRATTTLLVQHLANGSQGAQAIAAREIRLLAKTGKKNRAFIAEAGAIPHLCKLLLSSNPVAQENSVTAMLNLSIYDKNKSRILGEDGCLGLIVEVLKLGLTSEARENAAATLFSLSAVHDYKKRIADQGGAIEALSGLLRVGTPRGKKDAVTALFNLSTHLENCARMIEAGAVTALVGALGNEGVAEEAAGALALIVRQPIGAEAVGKEEMAVAGLITMMRCGTARGKENAVAALLELCRGGGSAATERVLKAPALAGLLQTLLFTGTKRARRKAASLARVFQRCENASLHFGGLGVGYAFAGNSAASNRDSRFADDVSVPMSISVQVL